MASDARVADFDAFYRGTAWRVVRLVHATTGDLGLAQDCTQEAYARAWSDWERVSRAQDPLSWVRTVARRLAISDWRRSRSRDRAVSRHGPPPPVAEPSPDRVAVLAALQRLSEEQRVVIALHYLADLSVESIAAELGAPVGTVKARLHRGRRRLAELLADHHPTPESTHEGGSR